MHFRGKEREGKLWLACQIVFYSNHHNIMAILLHIFSCIGIWQMEGINFINLMQSAGINLQSPVKMQLILHLRISQAPPLYALREMGYYI